MNQSNQEASSLIFEVATHLKAVIKKNNYNLNFFKMDEEHIICDYGYFCASKEKPLVEIMFTLETPPSYIAEISRALIDLPFCEILDIPLLFDIGGNGKVYLVFGDDAMKLYATEVVENYEFLRAEAETSDD